MGQFGLQGRKLLVHASCFAHIAQQVEHFLGKEEVIGSNPIVSTIFATKLFVRSLFTIVEITWKNEQTEYDAAFESAKFN